MFVFIAIAFLRSLQNERNLQKHNKSDLKTKRFVLTNQNLDCD